jgi:hypothetical protein
MPFDKAVRWDILNLSFVSIVMRPRLTSSPGYLVPNDEKECDRLDMLHALVTQLVGRLYVSPIGESPQRVLDVGTGTGIWAIDFGGYFLSRFCSKSALADNSAISGYTSVSGGMMCLKSICCSTLRHCARLSAAT